MNKSLYRLVKPYQSDKVYESSSIMHGAGKCYKELKNTNTHTPDFSIMDINTNQIYDFKVSPSPKMIIASNNTNIMQKNPDELIGNQQEGGNNNNNNTNINELKNTIVNLTERIEKLELLSKNLKL